MHLLENTHALRQNSLGILAITTQVEENYNARAKKVTSLRTIKQYLKMQSRMYQVKLVQDSDKVT